MIFSFAESWELFRYTYLAGWLIAFVLSITGVVVVARNQIFFGAAVAQASTLGIASAMWAGAAFAAHAWLLSDTFLSVMAVLSSVLGALIISTDGKAGGESREAVTGWVFLLAASAAIMLVTRSPHGIEEIHRIQSSSIIGASERETAVFLGFALASAIVAKVMRAKLLLLIMDPDMAAATGVKTKRWFAAIAVWFGLSVGLAIKSSGMLYTFGCLVLPALAAKNLCREVGSMFLTSAVIGVVISVTGFIVANHYDFPPGQLTVTMLAGVVAIAWIRRRFSS